MNKRKFTKHINVKYSETDHNSGLKPFVLLNVLQDVASDNAEELNLGFSYLYPKGYAWFLIKYHMEFYDYPSGTGDIAIMTEPRGYNKFFVYRDFDFTKNDKLIGKIVSMWAVTDIKTRSLIRPEVAIPDNPKLIKFEKRPEDLNFPKIQPVTNPTLKEEFKVRYNDIDVNGHANNGNYIIWAFEPLDFDFKSSHKLKTLDIIYKKEAKYGEKIFSEVEFKSPLETLHILKNSEGEELCSLQCSFE